MRPERIREKAAAYRSAWGASFNTKEPSDHNVALALAVAIHETRAGDAWPSSHNWGATTLRALNAAELAAVKAAGIAPTVGAGHEERARAAQAAIIAAGLPLPQGEIHCDSAPGRGAYFVWFATFADDVGGAGYFIRLLAGKPAKQKAAYGVLERATGTEQELASAMYAAGYYTGFHDPKQPGGAQKNIDAYAGALRALTPSIRSALGGADTPAHRTLREGSRGDDVEEVQRIVGTKPDGIWGPKTTAAVKIWQAANKLASDGVWGAKSRAKAKELGLLP